ncbi:MAG: transposase [Bacteroidales bacterium]|jgi:hypothetical protein|nr:transposase [Bacteroidales bacterium]
MTTKEYFDSIESVPKKQYDALREFFVDKRSADETAKKYGYTKHSFYALSKKFQNHLKTKDKNSPDFFFKEPALGRKPVNNDELKKLVIDLRKQNHSAEEIVSIANSHSHKTSYWTVYHILMKEGFTRLGRRTIKEKNKLFTKIDKIKASVAAKLELEPEIFTSSNTGLLVFLPIIVKYGIDKVIERSYFPSTAPINKMSSILCFLALKLSNIKRYSHDDIWCNDRGMGLFAGLNVLPKTAWYSSYSSRVDSSMNLSFLKELHGIWVEHGLLSDTVNLDFTTIPHWGDSEHLENNWSGKRGKALSSISAVLAQDPETGIIDYGNCDVTHKNESAVVLEYLDFYRSAAQENEPLKYLVFDSKFTNYENLSKLDDQQIKFVTIRRRGGKMLDEIAKNKNWKTIRVETSGLKKRTLKIFDENITLPGYKDEKTGKAKKIRQIVITGHGKIKPAILITNEFDLSAEELVRKYSRRWLVEKGIAEQIDFFHLNRLSSSMVVKVDFDMVMTILAHNLYRLLARELGDRYKKMSNEKIYHKFIINSGEIEIEMEQIRVDLKKKRDLPQLLEFTKKIKSAKFAWLENKKICFNASAST